MSRLPLLAFSGIGFVALGAVVAARASAPAAVAPESRGSESTGPVDAVPAEASPGELVQYLQANPQPPTQLTSRDQQLSFHRKLSQAKIRAANRLLKIGRQESHLAAALQTKRHCLGVLGQLGDRKCHERSVQFFHQMAEHENPTIASAARRLGAYEKLNQWRDLPADEKRAVSSEAQALLAAAPDSIENVRLASNIANVAGNNGDSPLAIELIDYMLPALEDAQDPAIQELAPKVEGLSRRLQLPGNFMELEGSTLDGKPFDWDAYRGKVVLVDYWATWCGPCMAELPNVKRCYEKYNKLGFEVVGVTLDDSQESVAKCVKNNQVTWTTLWNNDPDATGWDHPMAVRYGVRRLPQAILLDRQGKVVHMNAKGEKLAGLLEKLLSQPVATQEPQADKTAAASQ